MHDNILCIPAELDHATISRVKSQGVVTSWWDWSHWQLRQHIL